MSTIEDDDYISKVNKYLAGSPTLSGGGPDPLKHVKHSFPTCDRGHQCVLEWNQPDQGTKRFDSGKPKDRRKAAKEAVFKEFYAFLIQEYGPLQASISLKMKCPQCPQLVRPHALGDHLILNHYETVWDALFDLGIDQFDNLAALEDKWKGLSSSLE